MEKGLIPDAWERTFDALPDLIMILDRSHRIVKANNAMAQKLSCAPKDLSGLPCYETVHGTNAPPDWCPHVRLLADGSQHHVEATMSYLGGEYAVSVSPLLDAQGDLFGCVHVARDISALKRAEDALRKAHDELEQRVVERTMALTMAKERQAQQALDLRKRQNELIEKAKFEKFLANLSTKFAGLSAERIGEQVQTGLKLLVEFLEIDRCTFSVFYEEGTVLKTEYSYARKGYAPIPPETVTDLFPWGVSKLRRNEIVRFSSLEELPPEACIDREKVEKQGLKSQLNIPVFLGGVPVCVISFGSLEKERKWPDALFPRLKLFGEILANAVTREKAEKRRREDEQKLRAAVSQLTALKARLEAESEYLREEIEFQMHFEDIVGQSKALKYVFFRIEQVAKTDAPVLLTGETGTGKELAARAIHNLSDRSKRPLIKVNCASLPAGLIESELFGHEKGAFTGAVSPRAGRFELANGSTLFLDEIGELPLELQAKLLRVLEGGEFERLGGTKTLRSNARVVASTNRDLEREVEAGRFRKDLWYRLKVYPITLPPLRDREDDTVLLAKHFLATFARQLGKPVPKVPKKTFQRLAAYSWPGNVRELRHAIESAMISCRGNLLEVDLPGEAEGHKERLTTLKDREREHILETLETTRWKIEGPGGASKILDIHPNTLRSRMKKLGIRKSPPV